MLITLIKAFNFLRNVGFLNEHLEVFVSEKSHYQKPQCCRLPGCTKSRRNARNLQHQNGNNGSDLHRGTEN